MANLNCLFLPEPQMLDKRNSFAVLHVKVITTFIDYLSQICYHSLVI